MKKQKQSYDRGWLDKLNNPVANAVKSAKSTGLGFRRIAQEMDISYTALNTWCHQGRAVSPKIYTACQKLAGLSGYSIPELLSGLPKDKK